MNYSMKQAIALVKKYYKPAFIRRHSVTFCTAGVVIVLYYLLIASSALTIYRRHSERPWTLLAERLFNYPSGIVNGHILSLSRYKLEVAARMHYATVNNQPANELQIGRLVMKQLIDRELYLEALQSRTIIITDADVQKRLDGISAQIGGESKFKTFLNQSYGSQITEDQFRIWTREALAESAVQYQILQRATVRHILLATSPDASPDVVEKTRKKLLDVKAKITGTDTFSVIAKQYSEDAASRDQGGQLGTAVRGSDGPVISVDFETAMFSQPVGQVSDPIRSPQGWHLILVDKREGTINESLAEFTTELRSAVGISQYIGL